MAVPPLQDSSACFFYILNQNDDQMLPLPWPAYFMVLTWLHPRHLFCTYVPMTHSSHWLQFLPIGTSRNKHLNPLQSGVCSHWHLWPQSRHGDVQNSSVTKLHAKVWVIQQRGSNHLRVSWWPNVPLQLIIELVLVISCDFVLFLFSN